MSRARKRQQGGQSLTIWDSRALAGYLSLTVTPVLKQLTPYPEFLGCEILHCVLQGKSLNASV